MNCLFCKNILIKDLKEKNWWDCSNCSNYNVKVSHLYLEETFPKALLIFMEEENENSNFIGLDINLNNKVEFEYFLDVNYNKTSHYLGAFNDNLSLDNLLNLRKKFIKRLVIS